MKPSVEDFPVHKLVWAKVGSYPWWPGRVIATSQLPKTGQQVCKVSFFADPTYAYVALPTLRLFEDPLPHAEAALHNDFKFRKAVQLAQAAHQRLTASKPPNKQLPLTCRDTPNPDFIGLHHNLNKIEVEEKNPFFEPQTEIPFSLPLEPNEHNVLTLLAAHQSQTRLSSYCYSMRKEAIRYEHTLKHALLKRYNLDFQNLKCKEDGVAQVKRPQIKRKLISKTRQSSESVSEFEEVRVACTRRLLQICRNGGCALVSKQMAEQTMRRMSSVCQGSGSKMKALFITLVKSIRTEGRETALCSFGEYLQKLEGEKHFDEEGSKMTQISVHC